MKAISILKQFIVDHLPPFVCYLIAYAKAKPVTHILPVGRKVFVFLACDYGNIGDLAITYAQSKLLSDMFKLPIVEIGASSSISSIKGYISQIGDNDIVTLIGGGNIGDRYDMFELCRQLIAFKCKANTIISFPQTIDFSGNTSRSLSLLSSAKSVYNNRKLLLLTRDQTSYNFAKDNLSSNVQLVPDVVYTLSGLFRQKNRKPVALLCFRSDSERVTSSSTISTICDILKKADIEYKFFDTHIGDSFDEPNKYKQLEEIVSQISSASLVVTDRLHGMILSYITGTPAIVYPNCNWKVRESYQWIKDCGYIYYNDIFSSSSFLGELGIIQSINVDDVTLIEQGAFFRKMLEEKINEFM